MSSILDALRRIEREEGGASQVCSPELGTGDAGSGSPLRRIRTGAAVAAVLMCGVAVALWLSGDTKVVHDDRAGEPSSSEGAPATRTAALADRKGTGPSQGQGQPVPKANAAEAASPGKEMIAAAKTRAAAPEIGAPRKEPERDPLVGSSRGVGSEPETGRATDEEKGPSPADMTIAGRRRASEGVPSSSRRQGGKPSAETDRSARPGPSSPSSGAGFFGEAKSESGDRTPGELPAATSRQQPARSLGNSGLRERFAAKLSERMKTAESQTSLLQQPQPEAGDTTRQASRTEGRVSEPTILPSLPEGLKEAKVRSPDSELQPGGLARAKTDPKTGRQSKDGEEEVLRRRPPGAPYVRVSFLFYSSEPTRRRVMVTVNDGSLITLFEGQATDDLEVERILRDEVHFRYKGKLFAVRPRS